MKESSKKLTRKDIDRMSLRSIILQAGFNFERMQAGGFTASMLPAIKKIYGDKKEEVSEFMTYNMEFMNTEPHMATFLMGLILSLEESGEDRSLIKNLRNGLFGPLAGIGDAIFWFTLLPISAAICSSINQQGSILGPILYLVIWFLAAISRIWFGRLGYSLGVNAIPMIQENANILTKVAGILGVTVVGGLIPSYVDFSFRPELKIAGTVGVQDIFNSILPNLLPLGFVFLLYYLIKEKRMKTINLILYIIIFSLIMSLLNLM
ncbi:PTS system mannose/fructose/sorbose family transporter subunit IID [Tepidanaerobacter syntrophicus]|uniref:PTS system mannose/fructose/sorbose family transporter subunit IID n=1 Tax=Tepidanaerobacter syntrophicus TaxID=224999 RepID=UPI001BD40CDC|nr:PTS system mannose/fructose/sorbose family transporter subunit IID [Tepidanaerobacter syntrophicus]